MKNILFATDFSQASRDAFPLVLKLAEKFSANLTLIHVYQIPHTYKFPYTAETFNIEKKEIEEAGKRMQEIFDTHFNFDDTDVKVDWKVVRDSSAVRGIVNYVEEEPFDLIALAVRGDNRSEEKLFGSMIKNLISESPKPVMVIPDNIKDIYIDKVLFSSNLSPGEILSLNALIELFAPHQPQVTVVHIKTPDEEKEAYRKENFEKLLKKHIKYPNLEFVEVESPNIFGSLDNYVKDHSYEIIAMTKQWHSSFFYRLFHEDLVAKMEFSSSIPVISFNQSDMDFVMQGADRDEEDMDIIKKLDGDAGFNDILVEISEVTMEIKTNYPSLYRHLDEDPITIPSKGSPEVNKQALKDYLYRLKALKRNFNK